MGKIKSCAHVTINKVGGGYYSHQPLMFGPKCEKDSFEVERDSPPYSDHLFYGCPKDCRFFEPAWRGKAVEWTRKGWWHLRRGIVGVAQWYASLSPAAQAILALGLLALLGSPWRGTILEGLKIIFGK